MQLEGKSYQLPSTIVCNEFGEVNVRYEGDRVEVLFTILMEPGGKDAEGWRTGVALDASVSMKWAYGKKLEGSLPPKIKEEYEKKGWLEADVCDGITVKRVKPKAREEAIARGYFKYSENIMEPLARDFLSYLASTLDSQGKTTLMYWACGDGGEYEVVGDIAAEQCRSLPISGPVKVPFGSGTKLVPALHHLEEYFRDARQTMAIFITDGALEDFDSVKKYTIDLARKIERGRRNPFKGVLIGVGAEVSHEQMEDLDDLDTGTDVDIWDHKIASEMRSLLEIFAEVVSEHQIVAPLGIIYDHEGNVVKKFADGLPARVCFEMSAASPYFELEVGEQRLRQTIKAH